MRTVCRTNPVFKNSAATCQAGIRLAQLVRNISIETASALLLFVLAQLAGGHAVDFVSAEYLPSAGLETHSCWGVVGAAAGLAAQKTLACLSKGG
ncbi:MAG: hypothetical protein CVU44_19895 [Chloroflexi bacterium HGW-Chloroflexi-6]|nr:MAG: hypothetical protein CVU44_19895 [Chloroflexi bacterium HGW-Chloroflexi-6]